MGKVIKDIVKGGLVLFAVGGLLAYAAGPIAQLIGEEALGAKAFEHAMNTPKLWTAAFFGTFGAIHAAVAPVYDYLFGGNKPAEVAETKAKEHAPAKQIVIALAQAPSITQANAVETAKFQAALHAERAASVTEKNQLS